TPAPAPRRTRRSASTAGAPTAPLRSRSMSAHGATLASTLGTQHNRWIAAIVAIAGAFLLAALIDRIFTRRARRLAAALSGGEISPAVDTRLRVLRRVLETAVVFIGFFIAISQFDALDRLANTVLASSAILAAAVGFASRSTLANGVAGILLAVTQPLRV